MAHTKIQREVLRLSKKLDKVTEEDVDYDILADLELSIVDYYSYNGSYYVGGQRISSYREPQDEWEVVKYCSACDGHRVDRYVEVRCHKRSLNAFPSYIVREVAQEWHMGNEKVVLKRVASPNSNMHYTFWDWHTGLAIREDNNLPYFKHTYIDEERIMELINADFTLKAVYDVCKDTRKIERMLKEDSINGNIAEYLAKTKQKRMLNYYFSHKNEVNEFIHAIKVAYRHHYRIRSIDGWFSYLHKLARLQLDTHNPHYICPSRLMDAKKMVNRRIKKMDAEAERRRRIAKAEKMRRDSMAYADAMKAYLGITFKSTDGTIEFKVLQNVAEFVKEGQLMHNCIGGHYHNYSSLYMVALDAESGEHLANVEIDLKTYKIVQCYAPCNKVSDRDEILRETIHMNIGLIKNAA